MTTPQIVLASASPRRAELLQQIGVTFEVMPSGIEEQRGSHESPHQYASRLALEKARTIQRGKRIVLGADTIVLLSGQILEKPVNRADALHMLKLLQDQRHTVLSAVAVCDAVNQKTLIASAEVKFRAISLDERERYCATEEPFDKAGAYGIQGIGGIFIEGIVGQPSTVAGLPLVETNHLLEQFGVNVWKNRTSASVSEQFEK